MVLQHPPEPTDIRVGALASLHGSSAIFSSLLCWLAERFYFFRAAMCVCVCVCVCSHGHLSHAPFSRARAVHCMFLVLGSAASPSVIISSVLCQKSSDRVKGLAYQADYISSMHFFVQ